MLDIVQSAFGVAAPGAASYTPFYIRWDVRRCRSNSLAGLELKALVRHAGENIRLLQLTAGDQEQAP